MRLDVLGCSGGSAPGKRLSSYLIDGVLAVDAGALTTGLDLAGQRAIRTLALTHGHLDHTWTLPLLLAHRFDAATPTLAVLASAYTLTTLKDHLFNDRIWPDFTRTRVDERPLMALTAVEPGGVYDTPHGHRLEAIPLTHTVPCQAWRVRTDAGSLVVCGDTTSTRRLWEAAGAMDDLRGVVIECSWPDELEDLARRSQHMTPALLGADLARLDADVPVWVTHMKPGYEEAIRRQLAAGGDRRIRWLEQGATLRLDRAG